MQQNTPENSVRKIKFKQTRHITINDSTLPSKQKLLQITRSVLKLEVQGCKQIFTSLLGDKELLMLILFIFSSVVPQKIHGKQRDHIERYLRFTHSSILSQTPSLITIEEIIVVVFTEVTLKDADYNIKKEF
jgi:hypothetical protein